MKATDYLKMAQRGGARVEKVDWLFLYFKLRYIKKAYNTMIEYVGYTDEQIDLEIEDYLEREAVLGGGL